MPSSLLPRVKHYVSPSPGYLTPDQHHHYHDNHDDHFYDDKYNDHVNDDNYDGHVHDYDDSCDN